MNTQYGASKSAKTLAEMVKNHPPKVSARVTGIIADARQTHYTLFYTVGRSGFDRSKYPPFLWNKPEHMYQTALLWRNEYFRRVDQVTIPEELRSYLRCVINGIFKPLLKGYTARCNENKILWKDQLAKYEEARRLKNSA